MYSFADMKKRQRNGGPLGIILTDAIAKIFMTWWDRKMKQEAERQGLEIFFYKKYVDDINIVARIRKNEESTEGNNEDKNGREENTNYEVQGMAKFQSIGRV